MNFNAIYFFTLLYFTFVLLKKNHDFTFDYFTFGYVMSGTTYHHYYDNH